MFIKVQQDPFTAIGSDSAGDAPSVPAPRRKTLKGVRLVFNNGGSTMSGLLRDISDTGARVTLENSQGIPDKVRLILDDRSGSYACLVVRRELREIGLRFLDV